MTHKREIVHSQLLHSYTKSSMYVSGTKRKKIASGKQTFIGFSWCIWGFLVPYFAEFCVFTSSILTSTNKSFGTATIWWISWWSQYFFCIFLEIEASGAQQKKRVCEKKISSDFHGAFEDLYSRFCWILCFYRFYLDSSLLAQFSKFMSVWHLHCHTRQRCWM